MKIAVVTDSASDIPPDIASVNKIVSVPCIIVIAGQDFEDGKGLSREEFYLKLPDFNPPPTTAAPATGMFAEAYQAAFDAGYEAVVSIHPPANLSGIINAASAAAQDFGERVRVVDSQQASMGTGFQVLAAAQTASRDSTIDEVVGAVSDVQERVRVLAMLDSLTYLRRSGRVSWIQANLGNLLSIKTFIELRDGQVRRLDQVRTRRKAIEHLTDLIFRFPPLEDLAILHSGADQDAADLGHTVASQIGVEPRIINITTVIGTHVGPGGLGCAAVLKKGSRGQ